MKLYFLEEKAEYSKYKFPYRVYLKKQNGDDLNKIYNMGFLASRAKKDLFYLARGLRVDLAKFEKSSENRRILKKTKYMNLNIVDLKQFEYDFTIAKMGKDFYERRFGRKVMSANKIRWLFKKQVLSHVIVYKDQDKSLGYCLVNKTDRILHYAYPFYDLSYFRRNAGMGMMLRTVIEAKKQGLKYLYLGTCYSKKALYKTQFKGCEYFTGWNWSSDIDKLKEKINNGVKNIKLDKSILDKLGIEI